MPFGELLSTCVDTVNPDARLTWVPADFLAEHDVQPWRTVHLWADSDSAQAGSLTWSADKALAAGLTISPLDHTVRDTLAWYRTLPEERQSELRAGMSRAKEASVLEAWHSFQQAERN
jgi:2'-hydroxyisoflavone reductase